MSRPADVAAANDLVLCELREPPRESLAEWRRRRAVEQLRASEENVRRADADARDEGLLENFRLDGAS